MYRYQGQVSRSKIAINIIVLFFALYNVAKRDYKSEDISLFESWVIETLAPLQEGTISLKQRVVGLFDHYVWLINASKENTNLKKEIKALNGRLFDLAEVQRENDRLKKLLKVGESSVYQKVLAQIIAKDVDSGFRVLRVNKGSKHGISLRSPVVTSDGLVGYIYRVSSGYSDILTILDANNRVDGIITRTRTHGIIEGDSKNLCRMKYVVRTAQIEVGDEVITAGLGEIYPKGLKVGAVKKIEKESYGITQMVALEPSVDFDTLEEVMILLDQAPSQIKGDDDAL